MSSRLTDHEEGDSEVLAACGLDGSEDGAHGRTAQTDQEDEHDEPADGDGLRDGDAATGLGFILGCEVRRQSGPATRGRGLESVSINQLLRRRPLCLLCEVQ